MKAKIPVSLLTGFLGSGKTTLLTRLLPRPEFARAIVIINEFGEVSIDHLIVASLSESIIELTNGCLCCTIRGDLVMTLRDLHRQAQLGEIRKFDRVVIETSGLAEPIPLLHTLMTNPPLLKVYAIESLATVVDVLNVRTTVATSTTAGDQIALADTLILSKRDLASPREIEDTHRLLEELNRQAFRVDSRDEPDALRQILGHQRFHAVVQGDYRPTWLAAPHSHEHDHHTHAYQTHVIRHLEPLSLAGLTIFLNGVVNEQKDQILRIKGIVRFRERGGGSAVVHAVQNKFYPIQWLSEWPDRDQASKLVFIGRKLDCARLDERFRALCV
ncbi:MAG: GTP-binding protein [Gammaproteobacteria bacterium]|nr:GTP-binding protein [Gammaproteobacteria bacterium]